VKKLPPHGLVRFQHAHNQGHLDHVDAACR
jgi:hypothetical protein